MQTAKWFGNNFYNKNLKDSYNELTHNNAVDGLVVKDLVTELQIRKSYKSISGELTKSLDAFTNLEGENWSPYISRMSNSDKQLFSKNSTSPDAKTLFVFEEGEDEVPKTEFPAYEMIDGELVLYKEGISEAEAETNNTYLVGLVEYNDDELYGGGYSGGSGSVTYQYDKIVDMNVKVHKEAWSSGASEVHMVGFRTELNIVNSGNCGDNIRGGANCYNPDGNRITKRKRRHIGDQFSPDYIINGGRGEIRNGVINFVIFEQDSWPAPNKTVTFTYPNGEFRNIQFRSWQSYYDKAQLEYEDVSTIPQISNYSVNNSSIYYKLN
jgi:hypothetical protein